MVGVVAAMFAILTAVGCGQQGPSSDTTAAQPDAPTPGEPFSIVATVGMVGDLAKGVAGDRAEVTTLIRPGIDPHLYQPTRSDVERLLGADIVFYNGLLLEGKMTQALTRAADAGRPVHAVAESLDPASLLTPEGFEGHADPHVWMDPRAWTLALDAVRDAMIEFDPPSESVYRANAEDLAAQLRALDAYAERVLSTVPEDQRVLVTAHDAFNYFGVRFGFEVVGIQGISTESEAGVLAIERLVDLIVDRRIGAVFVESTVSDRNISALVAGAAARGHTVVIGGELFSDAMGAPGTYEGTYIGMIDHNVTTIARALGGDAPERGLNNRLGLAASEESTPAPTEPAQSASGEDGPA